MSILARIYGDFDVMSDFCQEKNKPNLTLGHNGVISYIKGIYGNFGDWIHDENKTNMPTVGRKSEARSSKSETR